MEIDNNNPVMEQSNPVEQPYVPEQVVESESEPSFDFNSILDNDFEVDDVKVHLPKDPDVIKNLITKGIQASNAPVSDVSLIEKLRYRKNGLNDENLPLVFGAINGDKGALKQLLDSHQIDPIDLSAYDGEFSYTPQNVDSADIVSYHINEIANKQGVSPDELLEVAKTFSFEDLNRLAKDPSFLNTLSKEIKNGTYEQTVKAIKQRELSDFTGQFRNKSFLDRFNDVFQDKHKQSTIDISATTNKLKGLLMQMNGNNSAQGNPGVQNNVQGYNGQMQGYNGQNSQVMQNTQPVQSTQPAYGQPTYAGQPQNNAMQVAAQNTQPMQAPVQQGFAPQGNTPQGFAPVQQGFASQGFAPQGNAYGMYPQPGAMQFPAQQGGFPSQGNNYGQGGFVQQQLAAQNFGGYGGNFYGGDNMPNSFSSFFNEPL